MSSRGTRLLRSLEGSKLAERRGKSWPGTQTGRWHTIFEYEISDLSLQLLLEYSDALFDWVQPDLPEDLAFLRGEETVLGNVAHELDAYLRARDVDIEDLLEVSPFWRECLRPATRAR